MSIKEKITFGIGRGTLIVQKYSPEILTGVGVASGIGAAVMASKATLKVGDILDEAKEDLGKVKLADETIGKDVYSQQDIARDKAIIYTRTVVKTAKLYAPAIALGAISISCILGAQGIMKKRQVAIATAYASTTQAFEAYRSRVAEKYGEEEERSLFFAEKKETREYIHEDGTIGSVEVTVSDPNANISQYAKYFDDKSHCWEEVSEYNVAFLRAQQNYFNDRLRAKGHVFLNEVYDALGIPRTQDGAVVGWVWSPGENIDTDNYIDFGIFDSDRESARDFMNGLVNSVLLDFNVDGIIYDKI